MSSDDNQICIIYELKEGAGEEYDRRHAAVWPDVLADLDQQGIYDYSIFRLDNLVISTYRRGSTDGIAFNPELDATHKRWGESLAPLFERVSDAMGEPLRAHRLFRLD